MAGRRKVMAAVFAGACFLVGLEDGYGQVVTEPALLTAGVPSTETFQVYIAFPENSVVTGGMIRFRVSDDVDVGGRAGLWFIDDADDTPYAGVDVRYGLLSRGLAPGSAKLNLSFDVGIGVSEPSNTRWKIPLGFLAGIGFRLGGGDSEIFAHPRLELGASNGPDDFDAALLLDVGGLFTISPALGAIIDIRTGDGIFDEGDQVVVAIGAAWRL